MKKWIIIVILSSLNIGASGQSILSKKIPVHGKTIKSFVPKGWIVLTKAVGDYNRDGIKDYAIVIIDSLSEKIVTDESRSLVILEGTKNGFIVTGSCDSSVLCLNCAGAHGDPFLSVEFSSNTLVIKHFGGTSWRWKLDNKFRYQNGHWILIRATKDSYHDLEYCEKIKTYEGKCFKDINYLTGESHILEVSNCAVYLNKRIKSKQITLRKLEDFNVNRQDSLWNTP